jgi:hypothetical protein
MTPELIGMVGVIIFFLGVITGLVANSSDEEEEMIE